MSLEAIGRKVAKRQEAKPWLFLAAALLITLVTLPGLAKLMGNVEPSIEKVLPQEIEVIETMNAMRSQYGADMMYLVLERDPDAATIADLRHPSVLDYQLLLQQKLEAREHILDVQTLAEVVRERNGGIIPDGLETTKRLIAEAPESALFIDDRSRTAFIWIRSDTGASATIIREVVTAIEEDIASLEAENPGVIVTITGFNAIDKATFEIIIKDFIGITGWAFLLMIAFLVIYFRANARKVALSLSIIMLALIWTLGLTGYLGITITVVTMVAAAMIMALGIDYGIHLVHRYAELRSRKGRSAALEETQEELFRAFLGSSLTTSAGFLALLFGVLPAMKNLGIILALGITITFAVSVFVTPVLLYLTDTEPATEAD